MSLNPLAKVTDYNSMLFRIFVFTLLWSVIATWLLRRAFPSLDSFLSQLDLEVELEFVKVPKMLGYVVPALCVALLARIIRLHDRISDLFHIREQFDVDYILLPLAKGAGVAVGTLSIDKLAESRSRLMARTFYPFASSTDPKIDKHLIHEALDWWSWYWVLVEGLFIFLCTAIVLVFAAEWRAVFILAGSCLLVSVPLLITIRRHCIRYAQHEVDEILSVPARRQEVSNAFSAL